MNKRIVILVEQVRTRSCIETGTFKAAHEYKPGVIIEPTGKSYACHQAIFFKVRYGLITEYRFYEDASFITQLGIDAASIRLNM